MTPSNPKSLYEQDFLLWVEDTVAKLKTRDFSRVDWENLIDEVESLAARDRRELKHRLTTLLEHALKRRYVDLPDCYRGWEVTINRSQQELNWLLEDSPSLRNYFLQVLDKCYKYALKNLKIEYNVEVPESCPFPRDIEVLLNQAFWIEK